jgi:SAM-dependent methyltransferase
MRATPLGLLVHRARHDDLDQPFGRRPRWGVVLPLRGSHEDPNDLIIVTKAGLTEDVEAITAGTARALATTYDVARQRRVLDLGGGRGSFLLAVLRQHPHVEATRFDVPAVAALTRRRLAGSPVAARLRVVEGDCFTDRLPGDHDAMLLANVGHNFLPARHRALLGRVRACAPAGARLLLVDCWTDPTPTQPLTAALMAGAFLLVTGEGDVDSVNEAQDWLQTTGWRMLAQHPLAGPTSVIVAETAA